MSTKTIFVEVGEALARAGFNGLDAKAQAWVVARINEHGYDAQIQNVGGLRASGYGDVALAKKPAVEFVNMNVASTYSYEGEFQPLLDPYEQMFQSQLDRATHSPMRDMLNEEEDATGYIQSRTFDDELASDGGLEALNHGYEEGELNGGLGLIDSFEQPNALSGGWLSGVSGAPEVGFGDGYDYFNYPNYGPQAGQQFKIPNANEQNAQKAAAFMLSNYAKKYGPKKTNIGNPTAKVYYLSPVCNAGPTPGKRFSYKAGQQAQAQALYAAYNAKWCQGANSPGYPGYTPPYTPGGPTAAQQAQLAMLQAQAQQLALQQQQAALYPPTDPSLATPAADPMAAMTSMMQMQQMMSMMNPGAAPAVAPAAPVAPDPSAALPTDTGTPAPAPHKKKHRGFFAAIAHDIASLFESSDDDSDSSAALAAPDATPPTGATAIEHGQLDNPTFVNRAVFDARRNAPLQAFRISGVSTLGERPLAVFSTLDEGARALVAVARRANATSENPAPPIEELVVQGALEVGSTAGDIATFAISPFGYAGKKVYEYATGPSSEASAKYAELRADWASFENQGIASYPDMGQDVAEWHSFQSDWDNGNIPSSDIGGRLTGEVLRANRVRANLAQKASGKFTAPQDLPAAQLQQGLDVTQANPLVQASMPVDNFARSIPVLNWITDPAGSPGLGTPAKPGVLGKVLWTAAGIAAAGTAVIVGKDIIVAKIVKGGR